MSFALTFGPDTNWRVVWYSSLTMTNYILSMRILHGSSQDIACTEQYYMQTANDSPQRPRKRISPILGLLTFFLHTPPKNQGLGTNQPTPQKIKNKKEMLPMRGIEPRAAV